MIFAVTLLNWIQVWRTHFRRTTDLKKKVTHTHTQSFLSRMIGKNPTKLARDKTLKKTTVHNSGNKAKLTGVGGISLESAKRIFNNEVFCVTWQLRKVRLNSVNTRLTISQH